MSPRVLGIKIPKKKRRTSKSQHLAYTGEEPDWVVFMQSNPSTEAIYRERTRSYDWYNYYHKSSSLFRDVEKWLVDNKYTKDDIKAWKAAEAWRTTLTVASSCKLLNNGMPDIIISPYNKEVEPKPISDHIKKSLKEVIEIGYKHLEKQVEEVKDSNEKVVVSIQERMREISAFMIEDIESSVDTFHDDMTKFNLKEFDPITVLRQKDAKANHARIIKTWYQSDGADYEYLVHPDKNKNNDQDQLDEAYGHLTKTEKKKANDIYKKIISACDIVINEQKVRRKPRAVKAKRADDVIKKLKFQMSDVSYGITSVPPVEIVGSVLTVIFNTNTRKIGLYVAEDSSGLSVKGTTIYGYDEKTSVQKTLRKPKNQLKLFNVAKTKLVKEFESLKTADTKLNGRTNNHCIILRCFK